MHDFAPGVIHTARRPRPRWQRWAAGALRWGWRVISVACVAIVLLGLWGMARGQGSAAPCACHATQRGATC